MLFSLLPLPFRQCLACGKHNAGASRICKGCGEAAWRVEESRCAKCGRGSEGCYCDVPKAYSTLTAPFYYHGGAESAVKSLKFKKDRIKADALGEYIAKDLKKYLPGIKFDFITEVPIQHRKMVKREWCSTGLIAESVANRLWIPYYTDVVVRPKGGLQQKQLGGAARRLNIIGSFEVADKAFVRNKRILLIDDVCATGSTLNEIAKILVECGAKEVHCATACVTKNNS